MGQISNISAGGDHTNSFICRQVSQGEFSIDIEVLNSLNSRLQLASPEQDSRTICRVESSIRYVQPNSYSPSVISIGPYHHGNENLKEMERVKLLFLNNILRRNTKVSLAEYITKIRTQERIIRNCYADGSGHLDSKTFVEMITLDGCFLVEWLIKITDEVVMTSSDVVRSIRNYGIIRDILLPENQIPFFVLDDIWKVRQSDPDNHSMDPSQSKIYEDIGHENLVNSFLRFLRARSPIELPNNSPYYELGVTRKPHHLLDLLHLAVFPETTTNQGYEVINNSLRLPRAADLDKRGFRFKKIDLDKKMDNSFLSFKKGFGNSEISMRSINMYDETDSIIRNLIAYEQCIGGIGYMMSNFILHLGDLIETAADVTVLRTSNIIISGLGSAEEVANLVNDLGKGVISTNREEVCTQIVDSYNLKRTAWIAELRHEYFGSPWRSTAVIAATTLLLLTLTQTVFCVVAYIRPPSD